MIPYAHTTDGTIDQVGALPALWLGPTRWHDWRGDPETWATQPADWGWLPVVETPQPDPIDGGIHESAIELVDGLPVRVWTWRPWAAEELAAQAAQQVSDRLAADTKTDLDKIARAITKLATLLGDQDTAGSVRALIGPTGATAGTSTLRAIRAKTAGDGTVVKLAASVDALAARCIDLAQLVIDTDQAARRIARQVQRLALAATGTLESADVGADI